MVGVSEPKVAEVATKRTSCGLTWKASITRRSSSAISAAWEPMWVCASSRMIQRSLPADFCRIGSSSLRMSMYSSMVALVTSSCGGLARRLLRSITWPSYCWSLFLRSFSRAPVYRQWRICPPNPWVQASRRFCCELIRAFKG